MGGIWLCLPINSGRIFKRSSSVTLCSRCSKTLPVVSCVSVITPKRRWATYSLTAFSQNLERTIRVYCEKGEIYGSSDKGKLHYTLFGDPEVKTEIIKFENDIYASHGGGDMGMVKAFTENYGKGKMSSEISQSMQSHYIGFAVQESSLQGGKIIYMDKR